VVQTIEPSPYLKDRGIILSDDVYCKNCKDFVKPERDFGLGTLLITFITWGLWVAVLPFYSKKCPYCKKVNFRR